MKCGGADKEMCNNELCHLCCREADCCGSQPSSTEDEEESSEELCMLACRECESLQYQLKVPTYLGIIIVEKMREIAENTSNTGALLSHISTASTSTSHLPAITSTAVKLLCVKCNETPAQLGIYRDVEKLS